MQYAMHPMNYTMSCKVQQHLECMQDLESLPCVQSNTRNEYNFIASVGIVVTADLA